MFSPTSSSSTTPLIVAVTGGSGFLAAHLIRWLQCQPNIAQIRTIDRKPFTLLLPPLASFSPSSSSNNNNSRHQQPKLVHHQIDLLQNVAELEAALYGVNIVFHLARKSLELLHAGNQPALNERYRRDNLEATRALLDALFKCSVPRFLHVGDAYANLPPGDNFGTSEMIHCSVPSKYMLGAYGESRTKAEIEGRERNGKPLPNGQTFHALFLRPVIAYGEGDSKLPMALRSVAQRNGGSVHDLAGASNGMKQFIYAGHLAQIMGECMELLLSERAERFSGEFFYCMDQTECIKFGQFCAPLVRAMGFQMGSSRKHWPAYFGSLCDEWICWLVGKQPTLNAANWSTTALQFLFGHAYGFTNRKMALILRFRPKEGMPECVARTVEWIQQQEENAINNEIGTEVDEENKAAEMCAERNGNEKMNKEKSVGNCDGKWEEGEMRALA